jgi:hypothetical protein
MSLNFANNNFMRMNHTVTMHLMSKNDGRTDGRTGVLQTVAC